MSHAFFSAAFAWLGLSWSGASRLDVINVPAIGDGPRLGTQHARSQLTCALAGRINRCAWSCWLAQGRPMLDRNHVRTRHSHHHPDLRVPLGYLAVIVGAGTLAFSNSLDSPFIWDDQTAIIDNPTIRSLWPPWGPL